MLNLKEEFLNAITYIYGDSEENRELREKLVIAVNDEVIVPSLMALLEYIMAKEPRVLELVVYHIRIYRETIRPTEGVPN